VLQATSVAFTVAAIGVVGRPMSALSWRRSSNSAPFAGSTAPGTADGTGSAARFNWPYGLGFDASGTAFVADRGNNMIRRSPAGVVTTLAGTSPSGYTDGSGSTAKFNAPNGIALDASAMSMWRTARTT